VSREATNSKALGANKNPAPEAGGGILEMRAILPKDMTIPEIRKDNQSYLSMIIFLALVNVPEISR
jgi:hypothetical protein